MYSLSILLQGHSKVGKSTLAATAPFPICVFDAEGSWKFIPVRKVRWDPTREAPPVYDGTWDVAVVVTRTIHDIVSGYDWLNSGQHNFRSVVVDSITEVQRKLKAQIVGGEAMEWKDWDELLRRLDVLIRDIRDLTEHQLNPLLAAVMVCESKLDQKTGKLKPNLQGSIASSVPYWFDFVGYVWMERVVDPNTLMPVPDPTTGKAKKIKKLGISSDEPSYEAGERVQGLLPDVLEEPNISAMLVSVFPELAETN